MAISYKKLWKMLIDKDMTAVELRERTGIAPNKVHFRIRPCFQLRQPRKLGTVIRCDRAEYLTEVISQFGLHLLKGIPYRISGFVW